MSNDKSNIDKIQLIAHYALAFLLLGGAFYIAAFTDKGADVWGWLLFAGVFVL